MASFGESLKRERELREISLRQISEATKINLRYLEALEENRFEALPGGLFNKGFIRAYATYIGIDGEAMVNSYLQEIKGQKPGAEPAASRGTANLHRPQEVPQRRAAPPAAPSDRAAGPALTLTQRRAQETRASSVAESRPPAHPPSHGDAKSTLAALERVLDLPARPTVSGIEVADAQTPASSRVLVWVLSLLAAAGVLFLIVSLLRGTMPGSQRLQEKPAANDDAAPRTPPAGGDQPPPANVTAPGTTDASAVVPEIASQSPLMLGAAGPSPAKSAPSAAPAGAMPKAAPLKRPALPPPEPSPGDPPRADVGQPDVGRANDDRPDRGPMKIVVEARTRTHVILSCDGREVLNRVLEPGETEKAKCDTVVRVSASDAGAVLLSVNGDTCLPLGDPGTRAYGYTIRVDDYARICPAQAGGTHGRR